MGFLDKFRKNRESHKKEKLKNSKRNFKYLNALIHLDSKQVDLDSSIIIGDMEVRYVLGIKVDVDDLVIDGHGYSIDSRQRAPIFIITGKNIIIKNVSFKNGFNTQAGGAIVIQEGASCKFENCSFYNNLSKGEGGALINLGNIELIDCDFNNNKSINGGAILNRPDAIILAKDTFFRYNFARNNGGAIGNFGEINFNDCHFLGNSTKGEGGAVNSQGGILNFNFTEFDGNTADNAGAIINYSSLKLSDSNFKNNKSDNYASVLDCQSGGNVRISKTNFSNNSAKENSCVIYNECDDIRLNDCDFINNTIDNIVHNKKNSIEFFNTNFYENKVKSVIFNDEYCKLSVSGGEFKNNQNHESVIYNIGEFCSVIRSVFEGNLFTAEKHIDIFNESLLSLQNPMFKNSNCIINKGHIDVFNINSKEFEKFLQLDTGTIDFIDDEFEEGSNVDDENNVKLWFTDLENQIRSNPLNEVLNLSSDFLLRKKELKFYEGGIDLDIDNLVIDGHNKIIDANNISRIFNVVGRNITLKNIIFKNGFLKNDFDEHANGGGAIRIVKGAKLILENCKFINNYSDSDGGSILNNGDLTSISSKFENNESKYYGGAVYNGNAFKTINDFYKSNSSYIAGAIYNKNILNIEDKIELEENRSSLKDIYNVNFLFIENNSEELNNRIFNTGFLNAKSNDDVYTFSDLKAEIHKNKKIKLNKDIIFNLVDDYALKMGIEIKNNLVIDGDEHIIDGNHIASLFKIADGNVVLKNITFQNMCGHENSIIDNNSKLTFENCKFNNNKSTSNNNLIKNKESLKIINTEFFNNISNKDSLINNQSKIEITDSSFINNISNSQGSVISNSKKIKITNSVFRNNVSNNDGGSIINRNFGVLNLNSVKFCSNFSKTRGGAIFSLGVLKLSNSIFEDNFSNNEGGAINGTHDIDISKCQFNNNRAKGAGGAIFNHNKLYINKSQFKNNISKSGGAISNGYNGKLKVLNTLFMNNEAEYAGSIAFSDNDKVQISGCKFEGNIP